jgi:hypothetical protein
MAGDVAGAIFIGEGKHARKLFSSKSVPVGILPLAPLVLGLLTCNRQITKLQLFVLCLWRRSHTPKVAKGIWESYSLITRALSSDENIASILHRSGHCCKSKYCCMPAHALLATIKLSVHNHRLLEQRKRSTDPSILVAHHYVIALWSSSSAAS